MRKDLMKNMLNESNSRAIKRDASIINESDFINGGFGGNTSSDGLYSPEHPSMEEIMKFVTATKEDIINNTSNIKMIVHFCKCDECRRIKDEMMLIESELDLALSLVRNINNK